MLGYGFDRFCWLESNMLDLFSDEERALDYDVWARRAARCRTA